MLQGRGSARLAREETNVAMPPPAQPAAASSRGGGGTERPAAEWSLARPAPSGSLLSMGGVACLGVGAVLYLYSIHTGKKSHDLERAADVAKLEGAPGRTNSRPSAGTLNSKQQRHHP